MKPDKTMGDCITEPEHQPLLCFTTCPLCLRWRSRVFTRVTATAQTSVSIRSVKEEKWTISYHSYS